MSDIFLLGGERKRAERAPGRYLIHVRMESRRMPPSDEEIRALLADQIDVQHKSVGMAIGIITPEGRRVVAHGSTGRRDRRPVDGDTAFEIASVTKVFTSLLLAEMVERGDVALDDPVANHLPTHVRVPQRKGLQITLVDLATHTSGLPPQPPDLSGLDDPIAPTYSLEQLYTSLSRHQLTRDIGSEWEYGNLDVALLGHALAHRAGADYESVLRTRVIEPLGLSCTTVSAAAGSNVAVSHDSDLRAVDPLALGALAPAGAMSSSANDLLQLLGTCLGLVPSRLTRALQAMPRTRRPMQPPLATMLRRHWRTILRMAVSRGPRRPPSPRIFLRAEQALGWFVLGRGADEMVVHDGAGPSCAASVAYDAKARVGVVVLSNAGVMVQDISRHLLWQEAPLARPRREVTLDRDVLNRYVGEYQSASSPTFAVLRRGDRLFVRVPYMATLPLRAESEHDFFVLELQFEFVFNWDEHGHVDEMLFQARRGHPMLPLRKIQPAASP
jgi:CubicO group peptidase (beta-lactamase class C family)